MGERTPGAFLPGTAGLSGAEIVRDSSLSPHPQSTFLITRVAAGMHSIVSRARVMHRRSEMRREKSFQSTSQWARGFPVRGTLQVVSPGPYRLFFFFLFFTGPLAGGSFPHGDLTPRAVRKSYFDKVCPRPKLLDKAAIRAKLPENYTALHLLAVWVRMMDDEPARCIEINERIFDIG